MKITWLYWGVFCPVCQAFFPIAEAAEGATQPVYLDSHEDTNFQCGKCKHYWSITMMDIFFWVESTRHAKPFRWPKDKK
jgi:hypothetical protein